ncbi:MAG: hypothetical protein AAFV45_12390 [Pseudomonadota bacterium]
MPALAVLAFQAGAPGQAQAQAAAEWTRIATQDVNVKSATAAIDLSEVPGKVRAFAISSGGSMFTVRRARFTYGDGRVHTERRRIRLRPGLRSKPIDRSKTARFADKLLLTFRVGRGGRGFREVEVWGLQTLEDRAARRDGTSVAEAGGDRDTVTAVANASTGAPKLTAPPVVAREATSDLSSSNDAGQDGVTTTLATAQARATAGTSADTGTDTSANTGANTTGKVPAAEIKTAALAVPPPPEAQPKPEPKLPPPLPSRALPSDTSPAGDVLLGAQSVGFTVGKDLIRVKGKMGKFSRIRLRVLDQDVNLKAIKVHYAGGLSEGFAVDKLIRPQLNSAWFPVKANAFIDRIELSYAERPGFNGRARVEVFGKHADGWLAADGEGRRFNDGWVLLAAQTAGFVGFDKDDIVVGENNGGFNEIRVTVRERAITLNTIKVIYNDGETDTIPVKTQVDAGSTYGPIALRRGGERIEKIQAMYRSRYMDKAAKSLGSAIVEFWARH